MAKKNVVPNLVYKTPEISRESRTYLGVEVSGPHLIMNRFADKAVHQMLGKHMGQDSKRTKKVPREVIEDAIQRNVTGAIALPSTAFKKAMLTGASGLKALARAKTSMRISLFVSGASVPITYEKMEPRMDVVRLAGMTRTPDIRFRPMFNNWKARFVVIYDEETIAATTVIDVINRAGGVGVGEWRPEKNGDFGTFRITRVLEKEESGEVMDLCAPIIRPIVIPDWALDLSIDLDMIQKILNDDGGEGDAEEEDSDDAVEAAE